ncbi:dimethylsulfonioproprionate lyase family protein [Dongia rigui]|uniref:Dimethylsulfonioproprionate lyase family protein n=1 Tax=Dongia rigui TaxID=940149 RepID=A0ABU5DUW3_9PROT|nr:dimethylsulfonioproprionate lyase family protein [Dongia rigui]MDY0871082.1 dimethylsulfonioproprionate lyase family protein [Dongia rigui]
MSTEAWLSLLNGIAARLGGHAGFADSFTVLRELAPQVSRGDQSILPVQRFWPAAGSSDPLGRLMAEIEGALGEGWRQNPNYRAKPPSARFLDSYGYLECAGPGAPYRSPALRVGLLLLGPHTLYPTHHHPAEEIYLPLGPGRWWKEGQGWQSRNAGDVIHHPPMCGHATESGDASLAAIYLWRGEIAKAAEIG